MIMGPIREQVLRGSLRDLKHGGKFALRKIFLEIRSERKEAN